MPHVDDEFSEDPFPLYYFSAKGKPLEAGVDEWEVEKILDHRRSARGWEFKVQWKGFAPSESRWEPVHHFFPQYNELLVEYLGEKNLHLDITEALAQTP